MSRHLVQFCPASLQDKIEPGVTPQLMSLTAENFLNAQEILEQVNLQADMKVADFGCGSGYMTFLSAEMVGKNGLVFCIDVQKQILKHIEETKKQKNVNNIKTIWADLEVVGATKIEDQSINLVLIVNTLYQCQKHTEILQEAKRVLAPSGELIIVDWLQTASPFGPPINERVPVQKILDIAFSLQMNKIKELKIGKYHFGLVFKK